MICPHCNYEYGWNDEEQKTIGGRYGDFYRSPLKMTRSRQYETDEEVQIFGCPSCDKTFIQKDY